MSRQRYTPHMGSSPAGVSDQISGTGSIWLLPSTTKRKLPYGLSLQLFASAHQVLGWLRWFRIGRLGVESCHFQDHGMGMRRAGRCAETGSSRNEHGRH